MTKTQAKRAALARRQRRVRGKVAGTAARPRLRVERSNAHIYAQLIDDVNAVTLVQAASNEAEVAKKIKGAASNKDAAKIVGEVVGTRATKAGISEVVFDRGGHLYHGRVKALADGARQSGLKF
ncbi:MAG: 50S ribosomal protein L18 [Coriobacteriia bacterium]|nr:50S ribosomal protein L18 [Coriobacteriia bacterium]